MDLSAEGRRVLELAAPRIAQQHVADDRTALLGDQRELRNEPFGRPDDVDDASLVRLSEGALLSREDRRDVLWRFGADPQYSVVASCRR